MVKSDGKNSSKISVISKGRLGFDPRIVMKRKFPMPPPFVASARGSSRSYTPEYPWIGQPPPPVKKSSWNSFMKTGLFVCLIVGLLVILACCGHRLVKWKSQEARRSRVLGIGRKVLVEEVSQNAVAAALVQEPTTAKIAELEEANSTEGEGDSAFPISEDGSESPAGADLVVSIAQAATAIGDAIEHMEAETVGDNDPLSPGTDPGSSHVSRSVRWTQDEQPELEPEPQHVALPLAPHSDNVNEAEAGDERHAPENESKSGGEEVGTGDHHDVQPRHDPVESSEDDSKEESDDEHEDEGEGAEAGSVKLEGAEAGSAKLEGDQRAADPPKTLALLLRLMSLVKRQRELEQRLEEYRRLRDHFETAKAQDSTTETASRAPLQAGAGAGEVSQPQREEREGADVQEEEVEHPQDLEHPEQEQELELQRRVPLMFHVLQQRQRQWDARQQEERALAYLHLLDLYWVQRQQEAAVERQRRQTQRDVGQLQLLLQQGQQGHPGQGRRQLQQLEQQQGQGSAGEHAHELELELTRPPPAQFAGQFPAAGPVFGPASAPATGPSRAAGAGQPAGPAPPRVPSVTYPYPGARTCPCCDCRDALSQRIMCR